MPVHRRPAIGNSFGHRITTGEEIRTFLRTLAHDQSVAGITCAGKTDGGGAQVVAVMSTLAYSHATGVPYFHTPFTDIRFPDGQDDWAGRWERFFNLGAGESSIPNGANVMGASDYLDAGKPAGVIVRVPHCHNFIHEDGTADRYTNEIRNRFREKYQTGTPKESYGGSYIALHVRRGDVSQNQHAGRYISDTSVVKGINRFKLAAGLDLPIEVFSQGDEETFSYLKDHGVSRFHLDTDVFASIHRMVCAQGLIMGKSSFSYIAALLGKGQVAMDIWYHRPLSEWLVAEDIGTLIPWGRSLDHTKRTRVLYPLIKESPERVIAEVEGDEFLKRESPAARWMLALSYLAVRDMENAKMLLQDLAVSDSGLSAPAMKTYKNRFPNG